MVTTFKGTGEVIRQCYEVEKVRRIVVGSGGSAYVDGGFWSMTSGLGVFKAFDSHGNQIDTDSLRPHEIKKVVRLEVQS
jgi:glycerate kinase